MFKIELTGEMTAKELTKKLTNLVTLLSSEVSTFDINFVVQEKTKEEKITSLKLGYTALKSNEEGLHSPKSEFEEPELTASIHPSIIERNGRKHYQTFYICDCGNKDKLYLTVGTIYAVCKECGKRHKIREAVKDERLTPDTFGNYFVAGKFKRQDEFDQDKSLYELFGANKES